MFKGRVLKKNSQQKIPMKKLKRCHLCMKMIIAEKYTQHYQICYRFEKLNPNQHSYEPNQQIEKNNNTGNRINMSKNKTTIYNKNNRNNQDNSHMNKFRIKNNIDPLNKKNKINDQKKISISEKDMWVNKRQNLIKKQQKQEMKQQSNEILEQENKHNYENKQQRQNQLNQEEQSKQQYKNNQIFLQQSQQFEESVPIKENQNNLRRNRNNLNEVEQISEHRQSNTSNINHNVSSNSNNIPINGLISHLDTLNFNHINQQNNMYNMSSMVQNTNDIINFIQGMNLTSNQTLNLMVSQLRQLNTISQQVTELSNLGNFLGFQMSHLFGQRIHELQTSIINQIGIALISGFHDRMGIQFQQLTIRQPNILPGFSKIAIRNTFQEKICFNEEQCAICLENIFEGDKITQLQCNHLFHPSCIQIWLQSSKKCPMCRKIQISK